MKIQGRRGNQISKTHFITFALILLASPITSLGDTTASPLETEVGAIKTVRENINKTEEDRRTVLRDLYQLTYHIKKVNRERGQFEYQLGRTQKKVHELTGLVNQLEKKVELQRVKLMGRLRTLYKFGGDGFLRLAFSSENSTDFDLGMKFLKIVVNADYGLLKDYQNSIKDLDTQRSKLRNQMLRLSQLKDHVKQKEDLLVQQQKEKGSLLSKIDSKQMLRVARIKILRLQANKPVDQKEQMTKLEALQNLLQPSFYEMKGNLDLPIKGSIVKNFGEQTEDTASDVLIKSRGLLFSAVQESPVYSVHAGRVVYSGLLSGYGKTIILDHGDHYYTVYAHLQSTAVPTNTSVAEKQSLGTSGVDPTTKLPALYFEVRHFSEAQDPSTWIKR